MMKKFFIFLACLLPWFITYILKLDYSYYKEINLPFFAPPTIFYPIAWTIIYILIAITIYSLVTSYKWRELSKNYKVTLLINYLFNQSYTIVFFGLKNTFLGIVSTLGTFLSALFLLEETSLMNNKMSKLLYPYIILSLFATILSISIYLLNI